MGRRCVFGCAGYRCLFPFPVTPRLRRRWLEFTHFDEGGLCMNSRLCDRHFSDGSFTNLGIYSCGLASYLTLAEDAVPSLYTVGASPPAKLPTKDAAIQTELLLKSAGVQVKPRNPDRRNQNVQRFKEEAPWTSSPEQHDLQIKEEPADLQISQQGEQQHGLKEEEEEEEISGSSVLRVIVKEEEEEVAESSQLLRTQTHPPISSSAGQALTGSDVADCEGGGNTDPDGQPSTDGKDSGSETDDDDEWREPAPDSGPECNRGGGGGLVPAGEKPLVCGCCGKRFTIPGDLRRHSRIHTGEKPFSCGVCGKRFQHQWNLKTHTRVHTGEKPFDCEFCGKSFTQRVDLKRHMRVHTGEKPFSCDFCGLKFTGQGDLKRHTRIHTGEKPFGCDVCGTAFRHQCNLKTHMRVHTGVKPYDCGFCGKSFTRQVDLRRHTRVHTGLRAPGRGGKRPAGDADDNLADGERESSLSQ